MDADERLIELKKAYAEILLNTAKEAAARVAASEMKAVRLERELNESKGQALQMLLRLKKLMDCKVLEAEMTSFNQQKKIQELNGQLQDAADTICKAEATSLNQNKKIEEIEAQLNEAEDIVKDLREELKEAYTELERARKNKPNPNESLNIATKETMVHIGNLNVITPNLLPPIPEDSTLNTPNLYQRNGSFVGISNETKPVIPSILLKSKENEFCGNRRTQRIRAFEEKLMAGELAFTDKTHDIDANYDRNANKGGDEESDTCHVEKKFSKVSVTGQRKNARFKKKKISSTKDIYNRSREIEDSEDNTQLTSERVGSNNEEFTENDTVRNTLGDDVPLTDIRKVDDVSAVTIEMRPPGTANEINEQPVIEKVFKYTFHRKRKRESMNNASMKSTAERPNCPLEEEKCSSLVESSRDSRRLALVAHQLISLSDKKW